MNGEISNTEGKVVLIDFWATWCGPCKKLIPEMNAWQQRYKDDLVIVGISDEPKETLQKFMLNTDMTYTVATDPLQRMKSKVGVTGIPHVLIISADNIVRWQGYPIFIDDRLTENVLSQIIEESKKRYPLSFQTQDRSKFVNVSALRTDFCQTLARKLTQSWQASSIDRSAPADFTLQIGKTGTIENLNETIDDFKAVRATRSSVEKAKSLILSSYTAAPPALRGVCLRIVFGSEVTVKEIRFDDDAPIVD
ncbi:MAG: TlpA family protein disulfide reductase [Candidatus Obscuribacter sp.]|nr:TlpA family protein disulfide reductase [Candidatus Obscuribacter sp.]